MSCFFQANKEKGSLTPDGSCSSNQAVVTNMQVVEGHYKTPASTSFFLCPSYVKGTHTASFDKEARFAGGRTSEFGDR